MAESQEFLNLESEQVEQWICSDEINVRAEDEVFKIILKWIYHSRRLKKRRKEKFEELFRHVRLALISREMLRKQPSTQAFSSRSVRNVVTSPNEVPGERLGKNAKTTPEFHVFVPDFNPIFLPSESRHRDKKSIFWKYQPRST